MGRPGLINCGDLMKTNCLKDQLYINQDYIWLLKIKMILNERASTK
jgi:hypothetical protein